MRTMRRTTVDIPDDLQAQIEPLLTAEGITVEAKVLELLRLYAASGAEISFEAQLAAARRVMNTYNEALRKLAE